MSPAEESEWVNAFRTTHLYICARSQQCVMAVLSELLITGHMTSFNRAMEAGA